MAFVIPRFLAQWVSTVAGVASVDVWKEIKSDEQHWQIQNFHLSEFANM